MQIRLTILLLLTCLKVFCQIGWQDSSGVKSYTVWQSKDKVTWQEVATVAHSASNQYCYPSAPNYYYCVKAGNVTSNTVLTVQLLPVTISKWGVIGGTTSATVYWTSENESNIREYIIDRSYDGAHFLQVVKVAAKGNGDYKIEIQK